MRKPKPAAQPIPLKVAILPPRIHPDLEPQNLQAVQPIGRQLLDGRGVVITSADASTDIGLKIVSTLTRAGTYRRVFTVNNEEEARQLGADALMTVTVWDYRCVQLGSNRRYFWMMLTSPLMSQYWIRWRTLEARFEWEVRLDSVGDSTLLYRNRLKRAYTSPVRSAAGDYFTAKMLSFLQNIAAPDYIGDLFGLDMTASAPAVPREQSGPDDVF